MTHFCFLTGLYSRQDSLIFDRQGKSLVAAGYRVSIAVCDIEQDEVLDNIEIISCGYKPKSRVDRMLNAKQYLYHKALEINADIYQISEPELIYLGVKLKHKGYKIVYNLREYYPDIVRDKAYLPKFARSSIAWVLEKYMQFFLRRYHAVFSVTDDIAVHLSKWGVKQNCIISNFPITSSRFTMSREEYMSRKDVLGYIGTVYFISCQKEVLEALEQLPNVGYRIAGVIEEGYADVLSTFPNWKRVEFTGRFDKCEMPTILSSITISNTLRDFSRMGTPNGSLGVLKIFESMEAGLPVLFSDVKLYRNIVEKYNCGICVDPYSPECIKAAIQYLVENKDIAYQMGQNGRRAVLEEFNWGSQEKIYLEMLDNL